MHIRCILMHMRTTLNIDDELLREAQELSGIREKTATVRAALEALIARESARRLAALGGTERPLRPIPRRRKEILSFLSAPPQAMLAGHEEALAFVETNRLMGRGIGWVDVHLLASARLTGIPLWTLDRRLKEVAGSLGVR